MWKIIVLQHDSVDGLTVVMGIFWHAEKFMHDSVTARIPTPYHRLSTTVLGSWSEVFLLKRCIQFSPRMLLTMKAKQIRFGLDPVPDVLWFIQSSVNLSYAFVFSF